MAHAHFSESPLLHKLAKTRKFTISYVMMHPKSAFIHHIYMPSVYNNVNLKEIRGTILEHHKEKRHI